MPISYNDDSLMNIQGYTWSAPAPPSPAAAVHPGAQALGMCGQGAQAGSLADALTLHLERIHHYYQIARL